MIKPEIQYRVRFEQDNSPVRGAFASGDAEFDKEIEDGILARLERGDILAWCEVTVEAFLPGYPEFFGGAYLCGCSYESEEDFKCDTGYYEDMRKEAASALQRKILEVFQRSGLANAALSEG